MNVDVVDEKISKKKKLLIKAMIEKLLFTLSRRMTEKNYTVETMKLMSIVVATLRSNHQL
jgi:hypothetical protein